MEGTSQTAGQMACSMTNVLMRRIRTTFGDDAVAELIEMAAVDRTAAYLDDVSNWISYPEATALMDAAARLAGDEQIMRRTGEDVVRQHAGTGVATLLRSLGSPQAVFEQLTLAATKFSTVIDLAPLEVGPGRAVVRARAKHGFVRNRHHCEYTRGMLSQPPALFGLPSAHVEESSCAARGDEVCLYTVSWDADGAATAADPRELVTALEAQLAAMTNRLESMYATARDLIAFDDVDAALTRITERAATAVRAPRYLLAVRAGSCERLHVHHRGFADEEAHQAAVDLLREVGAGRDENSRVVAEVASATRHYGRLMAASPDGSFFPHERELLGVYARYAAAVLDTATALEESRRRHQQAQGLLELAQAVATASTSGQVAARLAEAVPAIVDCDRAVVFLWDKQQHALVRQADSAQAEAEALTVTVADAPVLERLLASPDPRPIFLDERPAVPFASEMARATSSTALIIVPIVANERFYGLMNVSVTDGSERLERTPALLDCLAGVIAQAATALDNSRLIETMAHRASHDNLTGLLGHRAFHETLSVGLSEGSSYTLAMIDIDDFKEINDRYGHPVGDRALRLVADALHQNVRDRDRVFRVGGEEFAVVFADLTDDDALRASERLREAVADIPFLMPLRVSIGLASLPFDAIDKQTLIEHADAALYTAKRGGKDRTSLSR